MGLFDFFKNKKEPKLKPLRTAKAPISERVKQSGKKQYKGTVALTYEGKPIRQFTTTVMAYSRDNAAHKINQDLKLKLVSVVKDKSQRNVPNNNHTN
ncbi:MAG: hypothetical protein J0G96_07310 [Flavobacteriia bacterium]|nr:hypothetical protein [Flavobacteriia bacterium]OJX36674.1 MAG: hypothetical protein BGO87_12820 [Flavobacteriia bacterium 40-80]